MTRLVGSPGVASSQPEGSSPSSRLQEVNTTSNQNLVPQIEQGPSCATNRLLPPPFLSHTQRAAKHHMLHTYVSETERGRFIGCKTRSVLDKRREEKTTRDVNTDEVWSFSQPQLAQRVSHSAAVRSCDTLVFYLQHRWCER